MFNEKVKVNFINSVSNEVIRKDLSYTFKAVEPFEVLYNVDVCAMDYEQATSVANKIVGLTVREATNKTTRISLLQRYVRWCLENNVENANQNMLNVKASPSVKMREKMVSSPFHFQKELDLLFAPVEEGMVDNVYRAILWMLYSGLSKEYYGMVKCSDFDFEDMTFTYDGEFYPIYREAIKTFKSATTLDKFKYIHPNYNEPKIKTRFSGDEISCGITGIVQLPTLQTIINKRIDKLNKENINVTEIAYDNIVKSGLFFRALEMERSGMDVSFKAYVVKELKKKALKKSLDKKSEIKDTQINKRIRTYELEYLNWKEAFGYMFN